jgi:hypothetical protein
MAALILIAAGVERSTATASDVQPRPDLAPLQGEAQPAPKASILPARDPPAEASSAAPVASPSAAQSLEPAPPAGEAVGQQPDRASGRASAQTSGRATSQATGQATGQAVGQASKEESKPEPSRQLTQAPAPQPAQQPSQTPSESASQDKSPPQASPRDQAVPRPPAPVPQQPSTTERASPADAPPPAEQQRYTFHRQKDNFLRLDSQTGQVAQCGWSAAGWSCQSVPDERAALESEIGRLQRENATLKKSLLTRGLELPGGVTAPAPAAQSPSAKSPEAAPAPKSPVETDLGRAVAFMKDVWRRLVEMMVDLQRDIQRKS